AHRQDRPRHHQPPARAPAPTEAPQGRRRSRGLQPPPAQGHARRRPRALQGPPRRRRPVMELVLAFIAGALTFAVLAPLTIGAAIYALGKVDRYLASHATTHNEGGH